MYYFLTREVYSTLAPGDGMVLVPQVNVLLRNGRITLLAIKVPVSNLFAGSLPDSLGFGDVG